MNYKYIFLIFALVVLLVSVASCADKNAIDGEKTVDETDAVNESVTDYDFEVVDQLTEDLDDMSW